MPESKENRLEFQCPQCNKRLKAGAEIAGKKVKCPGCKSVVRVPGVKAAAPKADDDWLSLDGALGAPAIGDLDRRTDEAKSIRDQKELKRKKEVSTRKKRVGQSPVEDGSSSPKQITASKATPPPPGTTAATPKNGGASTPAASTPAASVSASNNLSMDEDAPIPFDSDPDDFLADKQPSTTQAGAMDAQTSPAASADSGEDKPLPSIFDDDLQLESLEPTDAPPPKSNVEDVLAAHLGDLDESLGSSGDDALNLVAEDEPEDTNPEYRITCSTCGTAQYVRLSQQGTPLKCPDCYDVFKVPAPTPAQLAKKKKKNPPPAYSSEPDVNLAAADESIISQEQRQRTQAANLLEKAEQQISDDDIDALYADEFDTTTFLHRTFGCFRDPICVAQIIGYGLVYGTIFAVAAVAVASADSAFGKGLVLLVGIVGPVVGLLFALPMLSGCLALIESVANRQSKVSEWPGFNLFDNVGDVVLIVAALAAAILPGFFVGSFMGRTLALGGTVQITAIMATTFALFPIFLLSMMDNGSIIQPISSAVFRSMSDAAEAWGGYYLKTLIAFGSTTLLWFLTLSAGPVGAAIGGFFLPVLAFFTCQQIGALADSIAEHLSFEFEPPSSDDDEEEQSGRVELEDA